MFHNFFQEDHTFHDLIEIQRVERRIHVNVIDEDNQGEVGNIPIPQG